MHNPRVEKVQEVVTLKNLAKLLSKTVHFANKGWLILSGCLVFGLMLLISADVVGRYLMNKPIPSATEMAETILVLSVFLCLASTHSAGRNIRVTALMRYFSPRHQTAAEVLTACFGLFLFVLITWKSWMVAQNSWKEREFLMGVLKIPAYISKMAVPIGCGFLCIEFLREIIFKTAMLIVNRK